LVDFTRVCRELGLQVLVVGERHLSPVQQIERAITCGGMRRSPVYHQKEVYLNVPIRMGVVNQVRQSHVKGTVPSFHYPITFRGITGGVDPLDPQHLAGLSEK
jgi:hypothetical protein